MEKMESFDCGIAPYEPDEPEFDEDGNEVEPGSRIEYEREEEEEEPGGDE